MCDSNHLVIVPVSAWSHLRLILHFSLSLLLTHPSTILTFLITSTISPRLDKELALMPLSRLNKVKGRWRTVVVPGDVVPGSGPMAEQVIFGQVAGKAVEDLLNPVRGEEQGRFGIRPCAFICDVCFDFLTFLCALPHAISSFADNADYIRFSGVRFPRLFEQLPRSCRSPRSRSSCSYQRWRSDGTGKSYILLNSRLITTPPSTPAPS